MIASEHEIIPAAMVEQQSRRIALETNSISDSYDDKKVEVTRNRNRHHPNQHPQTLENHESFLVCPGKNPVKVSSDEIGSVSIRVILSNSIIRRLLTGVEKNNGEIFLYIRDMKERNSRNNYDNHNHHQHNQTK